MDSKIGLIIQLTGVTLIAVLMIFLQRSFRSLALRYWTFAWLSLCIALFCLRIAFNGGPDASSLYSLYFFCEYVFGLGLVAGCRNVNKEVGHARFAELFIIPLAIVAIALPLLSASFDDIYSIHCVILSSFFAAAFFALRRAKIRTFGGRVMYLSLALLSLDFFLFFAVFSASRVFDLPTISCSSTRWSICPETALGSGW